MLVVRLMELHWGSNLVEVLNVGLHLLHSMGEDVLGVWELCGHHVYKVLVAELVLIEETVCLVEQVSGMVLVIEDWNVMNCFLFVCLVEVFVVSYRNFFLRIIHGKAVDVNVIWIVGACISCEHEDTIEVHFVFQTCARLIFFVSEVIVIERHLWVLIFNSYMEMIIMRQVPKINLAILLTLDFHRIYLISSIVLE